MMASRCPDGEGKLSLPARLPVTARAKMMIEGLTELSASELADVVREFRKLRSGNDHGIRRVFRGPDLIKLLGNLRAGSEFADDLEAVVRENRAQDPEPSPWEF
jgi:hypothetical protein